MVQDVRIGVIGAGSIFRLRHFPALADMADVAVVAIANRSVESARAIAREFDLRAEPLDDPGAVFERDDVDAVMIGTWPYKHHEYTLAALEAGKHVFVQARMAASLAEAKEMYARAEEADLVAQICPSPYAMHGDAQIRALLEEGYLGDVHLVRGRVLSARRIDPSAPLTWREVERYQGVNVLAIGVLIERLHRWVGRARTVSATARTQLPERPLPDGEGTGRVDLPDVAAVTCEFENGAVGSFDFSTVTAHSPTNRVELYGSDGTLRYDLEEDVLYGATSGAEQLSELEVPENEAVEWTVEADFVDAVRNGGSPRTTFREGVDYVEFTEAVHRSLETGSRVRLPLRT